VASPAVQSVVRGVFEPPRSPLFVHPTSAKANARLGLLIGLNKPVAVALESNVSINDSANDCTVRHRPPKNGLYSSKHQIILNPRVGRQSPYLKSIGSKCLEHAFGLWGPPGRPPGLEPLP